MNNFWYIFIGGISLLVTILGLIVSAIKYIESNKKSAIEESNEYTNKKIEDYILGTESLTKKISEIDSWKSDINTKMEVFNVKLEYNNKILETQSSNLKDLSVANQSIATSLAVLAEAIKHNFNNK